jgi:hypothetical protein
MDLNTRIGELINAGRDGAAQRAPELGRPVEDEATVFLAGWINGLEDALAEIVQHIERLSHRLDEISRQGPRTSGG